MENNICILQKIAQETQKWHSNFKKSSCSLVIDQTIILTVLIHNLKTAQGSKISMPFLRPLDNLLKDACFIFFKKFW